MPWAITALLIVVVLTACADDESERRFANDPMPTEDIAAQPTAPPRAVVPTATTVAVSPVPLEQLLAGAGTARQLFVQDGNRVVAVPVDGSTPRKVFDSGSDTIVAFAGSPDGERLAVVTTSEKDGAAKLTLVDAAGKPIAEAALSAGGKASPVPSAGGVYRLAWSPVTDRILVTLATGGILEVDGAGNVRTIRRAEDAPSPRAVAWSPSGAALAYVDAGADGSATGLFVASTDVLPVDPVAIIRPIEGRSRQIVDIAWAAGVGILYSERAPSGDLSLGGDLFAISPSGGSPTLIASAGGVSQVAAVGSFAVSPDGTAVGYTVMVPGENGPVVGSVKVQQIAGPTVVAVQAETGAAVEGLCWTAAGLTWALSVDAGESKPALLVERARPDGAVETIYSELPAATPVASPAATPVPIGTPVAD